jgi:RecB family exonuclease
LANEEDAAEVLAVYEAVEKLIAPLVAKSQPLANWAEPLRAVLVAVYGTRELNRERVEDRYLNEALKSIAGALDGLARAPSELQPAVDARQACRIVLGLLAGEGISPPEQPQSIELLGWLDLPLDDSPAAIVTTLNEGWVPSSTTADAYLPNRLREALGLMHNDRRLARDAYALSLLCASRRELKVVVARRDSQGNPMAPSRLLFLTSPDKVVERAYRFFGPLEARAARRNLLMPQTPSPPPSPKGRRSSLVPPRPEPLKEPIAALSVTKFRDYLACPYRFYLRHIVGLEPLDDDAEELDGGTFGGLAHWVLEQFGRAEEAKKVRALTQPKRIADYLCDKLDSVAAARFGKKLARPAVQVQVEQIRFRLEAFAEWQARRNQDGWRIVFSEDSDDRRLLKTDWSVDGKPFTLQGRIDRIDYHETLRKLSVVDYKTADRGDKPQQTHRRGDEWIDLQLPLYRHLVRAAQLEGVPTDVPIELGYIVLPLDLKSVGLILADWDEEVLGSADEKAREIVRAIWDERFWPAVTPPPDFFEDVAVICQDRRMGSGQEDAA